jgi:hypothetical protein
MMASDSYGGVPLPEVRFVRQETDSAGVWHVYANQRGHEIRIHAKGPRGRGRPDKAATERRARLSFAGFL